MLNVADHIGGNRCVDFSYEEQDGTAVVSCSDCYDWRDYLEC
jgi:hypothetical protein